MCVINSFWWEHRKAKEKRVYRSVTVETNKQNPQQLVTPRKGGSTTEERCVKACQEDPWVWDDLPRAPGCEKAAKPASCTWTEKEQGRCHFLRSHDSVLWYVPVLGSPCLCPLNIHMLQSWPPHRNPLKSSGPRKQSLGKVLIEEAPGRSFAPSTFFY